MNFHDQVLTRNEFENEFEFDPVAELPHLNISQECEYQINMENLTVSVVEGDQLFGSFPIENIEELDVEDVTVHLEEEGMNLGDFWKPSLEQLDENIKDKFYLNMTDAEIIEYVLVDTRWSVEDSELRGSTDKHGFGATSL